LIQQSSSTLSPPAEINNFLARIAPSCYFINALRVLRGQPDFFSAIARASERRFRFLS
jgi:hypothetical protein